MSKEHTFENVKEADNVYDLLFGWGAVVELRPMTFTVYFGRYEKRLEYYYDGRAELNELRRLYWNKVNITPHIRPDKMRAETLTCYVNIYKNSLRAVNTKYNVYIHQSREECSKGIGGDPNLIVEAIPVTLEFVTMD